MTPQRPWLSGFRLFLVFALFVVTGSSALAFQDGLKDSNESSDQPGLIDDGEYASPQYSVGVTWTDAWTVGDPADEIVEHAIGGNYDGPVASDPDLGDIIFLVDTASETSVLSIGFSPTQGAVDSELLMQAMGQTDFLTDNLFLSEDAEILLLDSTEDSVAILVREAAPNDEHVVYMQIGADPGREDYDFWVGLDMYDADEYESILTSIEDDIEVEDNEIFGVFTAEEMLDALNDTSGDSQPTEEATEEATEAATEEGTEEAVIPPFEQTQTPIATPDSGMLATPEASPVTTDELPGLNAEGDYVSPQHNVPVAWDTTWILDPNTQPPVQSFTETGVDSLYLANAETQGAIVYITIENGTEPFDSESMLAAITSPEYLEKVLFLDPGSEVVLTEANQTSVAVMTVDSSGDEPFVSILEARQVDEDTIVFVELRVNASQINEDLLDTAEDDIQVNGEDALDVLSTDDILDALP